jgi:hypothetical protein
MFMVVKLYIIMRTLSYFTKWTNDDNIPVCNKYFGQPGAQFALKASYKQTPFQVLGIFFSIAMVYFSLFIYSFDMRVFIGSTDSGYSLYLLSFDNSFWLVFETCTTLGYGEFVPKTILSRAMAILCSFFGWFFISLLILIARETLEFDSEEYNSYIQIRKYKIESETKASAEDVILNLLQMRMVLVNKRKLTHNFLLNNPNYQINFFMQKFIGANMNKKKIQVIDENSVGISLIPKYFLRFYNKISCFNALTLTSIKFQRINRVLKSFTPNIEEEMASFTEGIDKNFSKIDDLITSKTKYCLDELSELAYEVAKYNDKSKKIIDLQKKIANLLIWMSNIKKFKKSLKK